MSTPPPQPKLYHITHVNNLPNIVADGRILSDAAIIARGGPAQAIGMSGIKRRRVEQLDLACHPGTKVGDYVPFYFCPRSVMLYVIYRANHAELTYRGGQEPIVHLEADLHDVVRWAEENDKRWAFTLSNAGAYYAECRSRLEDLDQLDWQAISATDFRDPDAKERKQAEFLVHGDFPFTLIERIGVRAQAIRTRVAQAFGGQYQAQIDIMPPWYF
jgi:hypothetical protein